MSQTSSFNSPRSNGQSCFAQTPRIAGKTPSLVSDETGKDERTVARVPTETEPLLKEVFCLMREAWAEDFLFKMDPSADVCALSSPAQLRYGMITESCMVMYDQGDYGGLFDLEMKCRWLIVPVFSVGDVSAEVIVQSSITTSNPAICGPSSVADVIRLIRSDSNGDLLISIDDKDNNETAVSLFHNENTTKRKRVFIRFKRDSFRKALLSPTGIDMRGLHESIIMTSVCHEVRQCPLCRMPAGAGCSCQFPLNRAAHPMDFSFCRTNMMPHRGEFTGTAIVTMYSNGTSFANAILSTSSSVGTIDEPGPVQRMVKLGIEKVMQTSSVVQGPGVDFFPCNPFSMAHPSPNSFPNIPLNKVFNSFDGGATMTWPKPSGERPVSLSLEGAWGGSPRVQPDLSLALGGVEGSCIGSSSTEWVETPGLADVDVLRIQGSVSHTGNSPVTSSSSPITLQSGGRKSNSEEQKTVDRKLLRQIKNREAAARSNQRRKQRNDTLKLNLANVRERHRELEKRESELKMENAKLRNLIHGHR